MLDVLYEDNHLLAVVKPSGLPTMGTPEGTETLLTLSKEYIRTKYGKPGNVYLGVVSRLDAPVSGVVLLARTSKAAQRLTDLFRSREVVKRYLALVEGVIESDRAQCENWITEDKRHRRMHLVGPAVEGAKPARLGYRRIAVLGHRSLLEIDLFTGRKHQIRVQLAGQGHPVIGDRKYGGPVCWPKGIALHARELRLIHPVTRSPLTLTAPLPGDWPLEVRRQVE